MDGIMRKTIKLLCSCALSVAMLPASGGAADQKFHITVLSSRPEMVSGGGALVQVALPPDASLDQAMIQLNGRDVSAMFRSDAAAHALRGLVTGLELGENTLAVFPDKKGRGPAAEELRLNNYHLTGPIFSGRQEQPFVCETPDFKLPDGTSLGPPLDANCSVKRVVTYVYKSTAPAPSTGRAGRGSGINLQPLPSLTALPADVAWTTTTTGEKVPYVVRVETGTINRAIYQFAVLHDPTTGEPSPLAPPKNWNGRLLYSFGGGCVGGWFKQGTTLGLEGGLISDAVVGRGYAEAGSTLNVAGNSCNDVIAAETMMMVKERFIKAYGKPAFTFGRGASGGSYQQNQIADNYPGLLDGIIPSMTFPDVQELTQMISDSRLLDHYYKQVGEALTQEQKRAIAGVAELQNVTASAPLAGRINPTEYCPPDLSKALRYDATVNRSGARCDIYDHNINMYGRDPETGFARRPIDNTGVQYGLAALNDGAITAAQFLDLNEKIGGYDNDGNIVSTRSLADPLALRGAYQNGLITDAGGGLGKLPIIDVRPYRDKLPNGDNHLKYHSFSLRARLQKANGTSANDVMLLHGGTGDGGPVDDYALAKMDEWLTNLQKDASNDAILTKISRAKPADLVDSCWTPAGERIIEPQKFSGGKCNEMYPTFAGPRAVAGGPASNNVLKCQLKAIAFSDYQAQFSDAEKARLAAAFPNGDCDYGKPGVEQQTPAGTWLSH
jgi:Tannase-like family of unknown function (DUF6351)